MQTGNHSLAEKYAQTLNAHKEHLQRLQEQFNAQCDAITDEAKKRLAGIPEDDKESAATIIKGQKEKLEESLSRLKTDITNSMNETRIRLEEINRRREEIKIREIEDMMDEL